MVFATTLNAGAGVTPAVLQLLSRNRQHRAACRVVGSRTALYVSHRRIYHLSVGLVGVCLSQCGSVSIGQYSV